MSYYDIYYIMAKKKKRNASTFLKSHPDFLKSPEIQKKPVVIVASEDDSAFLKEWSIGDHREKNEDNIFNYIK